VKLVTPLIYTRVSTEEQGREGLSLDAQLDACRNYAVRVGWDYDPAYEFRDVMSGRRDDRPDYQRLLATARRLRREG
jgi:DNA invertase Pin-like site-specific DNA recombinase